MIDLAKTNALNERLPARYRHLVRPATMADAVSLAPWVRACDREEILAHSGLDMHSSLRLALEQSRLAWAFIHPRHGWVQALAGLNLNPRPPAPWASGRPFDFASARFFLSVSNYVIQYMFEFSDLLVNMVDARNQAALKWLRWEGFKVYEPQSFGAGQLPFHRFAGHKEDFCHV